MLAANAHHTSNGDHGAPDSCAYECDNGYFLHGKACTAWTTCSATQWQTVAGDTHNDRECLAQTVCVGTEYETKASGTHHDRVCASHGVCTADQWESKAAGTHHDRECTAMTVCVAGRFETAALTLTSDRECTAWTNCFNGNFQSSAPTGAADRGCTGCTLACTGNTYESTACADGNGTADRVCTVYAGTCVNGALIAVALRTQANHCGDCDNGYYLSAKACVAFGGACSNGSLLAQAARTQADHCGSCDAGYYLAGKLCQPFTVCQAGQHQAVTPIATTQNRVCAENAAGTFTTSAGQVTAIAWSTCPPGHGATNTPSATVDRTCAACMSGTSFSGADDGLPCTPADVCAGGEYEKVAPTRTTDRTCATHAAACSSHEYESQAPSGTQDRECKQKVCHCPNGVFTTGDACPKHGNPKCSGCIGAYHLANGDNQCDANTCSCINGPVAFGAACTVHGATKCTSCNGAYRLENQNCVITPVNGGWFNWSSYGSCSATGCSSYGTKTRTRTCTNPAPAHGGAGCAGSASTTTACSTALCPEANGLPTSQAHIYQGPSNPCIRANCNTPINGVYEVPTYNVGSSSSVQDSQSWIHANCVHGWVLMQKRSSASLSFEKTWDEYAEGFSDKDNMWLGNENIHRLTRGGAVLRVRLRESGGTVAVAEYSNFKVGNAASKYALTISGYKAVQGNPGDAMGYHHARKFSTKDQDNDTWGSSCATKYHGAWWYGACHHSNLNGVYHTPGRVRTDTGVTWATWAGFYNSMKYVDMLIKPTAHPLWSGSPSNQWPSGTSFPAGSHFC
jgi:ficolin